MPFTNIGRNNMLGGVAITHASLHSGFPGISGANEITGGSPAYARKAVSFNAASGGSRAQAGSAVFDVPGATTVRYVAFWDALTGGNFIAYQPLGSATAKEFIVDIASDLIRLPAHGYADTDQVVFIGDTVPTGLTEGTIYFVRDSTSDNFKVAATSGGTAIDLTSQAGTACQVVKIVAETLGSQGTITLSAATLGLNL